MATQNGERLAKGLGWFSIGLGVAELVAPGAVTRFIGVEDGSKRRAVARLYGLREIAAGIGILAQPQRAGWIWGRVAGDALDLSSLGSALQSNDTNRTRVAISLAALAGVTALDVLCAEQLSESHSRNALAGRMGRVVSTVIIDRSPEELYQFWSDVANLPKFMRNLESVQRLGEHRTHWRVKALGGKIVEWDAETTEDQPNSKIAWRSIPGSGIENSGSVRFDRAPGGRGTLVRLEMRYSLPGGALATNVAKLFHREPGQQIAENLRAFKQLMETGEIIQSDASIHPNMHAARPAIQ